MTSQRDLPGVVFEKAQPIWSLRDASPHLWAALDPAARDAIDKFRLDERTPVAETLAAYTSATSVRPLGSRRAFYIRLASGGVIAVKGSEVRNRQLRAALEEDALRRRRDRPWTAFENFIFREQKLPLAMSRLEAQSECDISLQLQTRSLETFGTLELAPLPLFVHAWPEEVVANYFSTLEPHLNSRARDLAKPLLAARGLATYLYYYPHVPYRIGFSTPTQATDFESRLRELKQVPNAEAACDAPAAVEQLLKATTRLLLLGYFPLAFHDYGTGQCIASQNVTTQGGLTDMDSLFPFTEVKSEREFHELFYSTIAVLCSTLRAFLLSPLPVVEFEFSDPSTVSVLFTNFVWERLRSNFRDLRHGAGLKIDVRLAQLLEPAAAIDLPQLLRSLYPAAPAATTTRHPGPDKGAPRHRDL